MSKKDEVLYIYASGENIALLDNIDEKLNTNDTGKAIATALKIASMVVDAVDAGGRVLIHKDGGIFEMRVKGCNDE